MATRHPIPHAHNFQDMTGRRFGRLQVLAFAYTRCRRSYWRVLCDCGRKTVVPGRTMRNETCQSCGCLRREKAAILGSTKVLPAWRNDLTGQRFGRLLVVRHAGDRKWLCRCDCGTEKSILAINLTNRATKSCGCLHRDMAGKTNRVHGLSGTKEFRIWASMKSRCQNPNQAAYRNYGGRGIGVCERWLGRDGFSNFYADMGPRPSPRHSMERKDVNGGYGPDNCVWASRYRQGRNRRSNRLITLNGETMCLTDWCIRLGLSVSCLNARLKKLPPEQALCPPEKD